LDNLLNTDGSWQKHISYGHDDLHSRHGRHSVYICIITVTLNSSPPRTMAHPLETAAAAEANKIILHPVPPSFEEYRRTRTTTRPAIKNHFEQTENIIIYNFQPDALIIIIYYPPQRWYGRRRFLFAEELDPSSEYEEQN